MLDDLWSSPPVPSLLKARGAFDPGKKKRKKPVRILSFSCSCGENDTGGAGREGRERGAAAAPRAGERETVGIGCYAAA